MNEENITFQDYKDVDQRLDLALTHVHKSNTLTEVHHLDLYGPQCCHNSVMTSANYHVSHMQINEIKYSCSQQKQRKKKRVHFFSFFLNLFYSLWL